MRIMTLAPARTRRAFTLIELLIVMAIIAALASLAVGAVLTVRDSQMKSVTETTVQKLASALDQHWKGSLDQIYEETVPQWAINMSLDSAGNPDVRLARVIYTKVRLKQEFPVTFLMALNPSGQADNPTVAGLP